MNMVRKEWRDERGKVYVRYETASVEMAENAMKKKPKPRHVGGGWYELEDGRRVRKSDIPGGEK